MFACSISNSHGCVLLPIVCRALPLSRSRLCVRAVTCIHVFCAMLEQLTHMDRISQIQHGVEQLLTIMSSSIVYLHTRTSFKQVSDEIPITRQRNPDKFDPPDVFESNQRELVTDLIRKAKEIEFLIQSLPVPESEEDQAHRLEQLERDMVAANGEYRVALERAKKLHTHIADLLERMLSDGESPPEAAPD